MAISLNKLFVNFKGTKAQFENVKAQYANQIVFINEGKTIYAKGAYYGSVDEAIAGLKYFTSIKVGEKVASAPDNKGIITFAPTADSSIALDVDARGITIGLSQATKDAIAAAAVKADVDASIADIEAAIEALEAIDVANRLKALEEAIGLGVEGEEPDATVTAQIASLNQRVGAEEVARAEADAALQEAIDAKVAQSAYDAKVAELAGATAQVLVDAKAYADGLVYNDEALSGRVSAVEDAVEVLNGAESVEGSVAKTVKDAINNFANELSDDSTVNTFKELIDYAAEHGSEYSELAGVVQGHTTAINTLNGEGAGSVKAAVAAEKERAELAESGLDTKISNLDAAYKAADEALAGRVQTLENDHLGAADKQALEASIAEKVAQSAYDAKVVELAKADTDNLAAAKKYADDNFQVKGNYEAAGAAATVQGKLDAEVNRAKAAEEANAAAIKVNQDDIDAIEAFLNDPWQTVNE